MSHKWHEDGQGKTQHMGHAMGGQRRRPNYTGNTNTGCAHAIVAFVLVLWALR